MTDPTTARQAGAAEYVRTVLPVVATYTRQVLVAVDLNLLRDELARRGEHAQVAWVQALIDAKGLFERAERLAEMAASSPVVLTPTTPEGAA